MTYNLIQFINNEQELLQITIAQKNWILQKVFKQVRQKTNPKKLEETEFYCRIKHNESLQVYNYQTNEYVDVIISQGIMEQIKAIQIYLSVTDLLANSPY
jgi:hypothetical protein